MPGGSLLLLSEGAGMTAKKKTVIGYVLASLAIIARNGFSLRAQEVSPSIGVVVAKAGRILPTQRNDMRPHIAVVICDLRRHLRKVDRHIRIGK